ncbi:MAG: DUF58 domain-containing protein [Bacteroidales bacterium]
MSEGFRQTVSEPFISLELLASQVVEGFITGLHKSPFHGFSVEFAEHRQYNTGESVRHIDWKLFGRTDRLFVKRYEEETNLRCHILIDTSSSMYFPVEKAPSLVHPNKLIFSIYSSAALMNLLYRQRDAVGFTAFSDQIDLQTEDKSNKVHLKYMYSELERILNISTTPVLNRGSNLTEILHLAAEQIHKRSLIVIFSDMFDSISSPIELFSALQHLKYRNNEVLLFYVHDKEKELEFTYPNKPYRFIDMEKGSEIKINPAQIRQIYSEKVYAFKKELKMQCERYKIDFIEADIQKGFIPVLQAYLAKRRKIFK